MIEITPEQIRAYDRLRMFGHELEGFSEFQIAADALRDTTAALMQSEFEREHRIDYRYQKNNCGICGTKRDPRHLFKFGQWQAAAEKLLTGEGHDHVR